MKTTQPVRTRFAPSPTGNLHIGGARTALFAYLWAKKNNGQFLLRLEDTDKVREKEGSEDSIVNGLHWLGITWDEGIRVDGPKGPYKQSERLAIYKEHADQLIAAGKAYYCFCTPERLDAMRKEQQANKLPPRYDRHCRNLSTEERDAQLQSGAKHVVRMAVPEEGEIVVQELLRGTITFQNKDIDDQVLMKSDGFPTYHLANVVDDHLMDITHVIRGEEWLPSTPKHVLLYQFFGWDAPVFVHLTVFLSKSGTGKMSKRDGATSLMNFRDLGYLSEGIVNGISLLGWNPKTTEELFTMDELIQRFDLSMINTANPIFDTEKLNWINQQYLRKLTTEQLVARITELAKTAEQHNDIYQRFADWFPLQSEPRQLAIWQHLKERCHTLLEVAQSAQTDLAEYETDKLIWKKSTKDATIEIFAALIPELENIPEDDYIVEVIDPKIRQWIAAKGWGNGDVLWPMRYSLSGVPQSPSPFELAELLGKAETIRRLEKAQERLAA